MTRLLQIRTVCAMLVVFLLLTGCKKEIQPAQENEGLPAMKLATQSEGMVMGEIQFTAIARIGYCHGEDIQFTGWIENRVKTTTSASGQTTYTRHFTVRGMTARGVVTGTGTTSVPIQYTSNYYNVIGGAEMFSIKNPVFTSTGALNLPGSLQESDIVIHRGTLVFENVATGEKVIARHDIQKVPGAGTKTDRWLCGGN